MPIVKTPDKGKKKEKNNSEDELDFILPSDKIINRNNKSGSVLSRQSKKVTVYQVRKHLASRKDPTEENIKKLLLLSGSNLDTNTAEKIFERAVNKRPILQQKRVEEEQTAFTEEDFKNFEAEYLAS